MKRFVSHLRQWKQCYFRKYLISACSCLKISVIHEPNGTRKIKAISITTNGLDSCIEKEQQTETDLQPDIDNSAQYLRRKIEAGYLPIAGSNYMSIQLHEKKKKL